MPHSSWPYRVFGRYWQAWAVLLVLVLVAVAIPIYKSVIRSTPQPRAKSSPVSKPTPSCPAQFAYSHPINPRDPNFERSDVVIVGSCGRVLQQFKTPHDRSFDGPTLSPDGTTVAFTPAPPDISQLTDAPRPASEIYLGNIGTGTMTRLTNMKGNAFSPAFSPDGKEIAFGWQGYVGNSGALDPSNEGVYEVPVTGQAQPVKLYDQDGTVAWSSDGKKLSVVTSSGASMYLMRVIDIATHHEDFNTSMAGPGVSAFFSPDGRSLLIVYTPDAVPGAGEPRNQVWEYDLATQKTKQLTHVPSGIASADITNDWNLYYQVAGQQDTSIHSLDLATGKDLTLVPKNDGVRRSLSVRHYGPVAKTPLLGGS